MLETETHAKVVILKKDYPMESPDIVIFNKDGPQKAFQPPCQSVKCLGEKSNEGLHVRLYSDNFKISKFRREVSEGWGHKYITVVYDKKTKNIGLIGHNDEFFREA
jgi:hypothetical protein